MSSDDPTSTSSATPQPAPPEFLQDRLSTLLASPYIHFKKPTSGPLLGLRMGPGPVDLFSTRFANFFTHAATGVVAGTEVDRDGLKDALLALQRRWDPNSASFSSIGAVGDAQPVMKFAWTQSTSQEPAEFNASGDILEEGGTQRIHLLTLDGDASLFTTATTEE